MESYGQVYERYSRAMYHTCLRIVGNTADAEDLLQEGFLEAFLGLARLKDTHAFAGWLKRIIINRALNYVKRERKNWEQLEDTNLAELSEDAPIDEEDFVRKIAYVHKQLKLLPDIQRIVIGLHVFEDLGFEDIASLMNVPSATVRSHYIRGRKRILGTIKD